VTPAIDRRHFLAGLLAAPVVAACGGGGDDAAPTTTGSTTTSSTATSAPPAVQPLTGLPHSGDPAVLTRPALVAKIDNADGAGTARPQAGINQADVVVEERVEGSVTRLAAVFHSQDADPVGPIRSFRTTDLHIVANLNQPLLAWSGANADFARLAREGPLVDVGYDAVPDAYYRDPDRRAPHNLMTSTPALRAHTPEGAGPPPPLFTYRAQGSPLAGGRPVADVRVSYGSRGGSAPVNYRTDTGTGTFLRFQRDTPHLDAAGVQVQVENVVIMHVRYVPTGATDSGGNPVPEAELIGEGTAWVLSGGSIVEGRWSRPSEEAVATLVDAAGAVIALAPGRTWVALPEDGGATIVA
jgi:hypothetical protein